MWKFQRFINTNILSEEQLQYLTHNQLVFIFQIIGVTLFDCDSSQLCLRYDIVILNFVLRTVPEKFLRHYLNRNRELLVNGSVLSRTSRHWYHYIEEKPCDISNSLTQFEICLHELSGKTNVLAKFLHPAPHLLDNIQKIFPEGSEIRLACKTEGPASDIPRQTFPNEHSTC